MNDLPDDWYIESTGESRILDQRKVAAEIKRLQPAPTSVIFTEDEIKTIRDLIDDRGFEYSLTSDRDKVMALAEKLGMSDYVRRNDV